MEDTDSAVFGHGIFLNYGSVLRGTEAAIGIGHEIVAAIRAEGLPVDWDGTLDRHIVVKLDWKRRLPPATPPRSRT